MTQTDGKKTDGNTPRLLGGAFLWQAIASLVSGVLLSSLIVTGDMSATMTRIATHATLMRVSIVGEMITAIGIVVLSVLLYQILRRQDEVLARVALGLRLVEAALLAASRIPAFALLRTSQEFVTAGDQTGLRTLASVFYESQEFAYSLNMLFFALGATLFYYLFFRSRLIPRALSLVGLVVAPLAILGTLGELLGLDVPIIVFAPNLPFELAMGIWLLVRGVRETRRES